MGEINSLTVEAAALFRDMLKENCIEEFVDLSDFQICYVKDMPELTEVAFRKCLGVPFQKE